MASHPKVLLIGWDAADWKVIHPLMDAGQMPHVQSLVERGSMAQLATLRPPLSPMLWTSIATGKRPFKHGIHGFSEPTPDGRAVQPVSILSRKCKAVWNILSQNALRSVVVGWWPSHPAEPIRGVTVSDFFHRAPRRQAEVWPLLPGAVHPAELADSLAELRLHPEGVAGEMLEYFVPRAQESIRIRTPRLAQLARTLAECVTIHSAATWLLEREEWDFFAVYYDAIDHFCHGFMRYHPPRQEFIPEKDFDLYHNVVAAAYRFHDQMLGTLLAKAGDDVRVILMSDHGFHPDHLRPKSIPAIPAGPAIEHRNFGILAMAGPGIRKDELLHGPCVLDIAPTILTMFGLPVGEDMDGKALVAAFEQPDMVEAIPSWEDVPGEDGRHPPHALLDPVAARDSLEQLVALGYIEKPDENAEKAVADTLDELQYNLGQAYQDDAQHAAAREIFHALYEKNRDEQRYAVHLFISCQALGLIDEMRAIVEDLDGPRRQKFLESQQRLEELRKVGRARAKQAKDEREAKNAQAEENLQPGDKTQAKDKKPKPLFDKDERLELMRCRRLCRFDPPVVDYLKAQVLTAQGLWGKALDCLERVGEANLARPGLFLQAAELYAKMRQWEYARATWAKALSLDPDDPHAHVGMCRAHLHQRDFPAAALSALAGVQRLYHYPAGHFLLGVALIGMREFARAEAAFRTALALNPNYPQAHLRLGFLLRRLGRRTEAQEHFQMFRQLRVSRRPTERSPAQPRIPAAAVLETSPSQEPLAADLPPLDGEVVIVSGLPRSGTSMVMQMLSAGGLPALVDGIRQADEDNPLGYFEYEPVKRMASDCSWLADAKGKGVKVVAPLLPRMPVDVTCRVILIERDLDEILASQGQMLIRRGEKIDDTLARRDRLKQEYSRLIIRLKTFLASRPGTHLLCLRRNAVLIDPQAAARAINGFVGGHLDVVGMANQVKPELNRHTASA